MRAFSQRPWEFLQESPTSYPLIRLSQPHGNPCQQCRTLALCPSAHSTAGKTMTKLIAAIILVHGLVASEAALAVPFTADTLVRLDRVGAPVLSPDGSKIVYSVRKTDMAANKGRYHLWWTGFSDAKTHRLTTHEADDTKPAWSPDGNSVYFLSKRNGSSQVWRIAPGGGEAEQVTDLPVDVGTFRVGPGGDRLVLSAKVYLDCEELACSASRDAA